MTSGEYSAENYEDYEIKYEANYDGDDRTEVRSRSPVGKTTGQVATRSEIVQQWNPSEETQFLRFNERQFSEIAQPRVFSEPVQHSCLMCIVFSAVANK